MTVRELGKSLSATLIAAAFIAYLVSRIWYREESNVLFWDTIARYPLLCSIPCFALAYLDAKSIQEGTATPKNFVFCVVFLGSGLYLLASGLFGSN